MAGLVFKNGVRETSTTTGTGTYTLAGAPTGFQPFSVAGAGNRVRYRAGDGTSWEIGEGTVSVSPATLTRDKILGSSSAGAAVNWAAGTREIRLILDADMLTAGLVATGVTQRLAPVEGLVIEKTSASSVTATCTRVVMTDDNGIPVVIAPFNKTFTITITGLGGLDVGTEAANTWYYIWGGYNPITNTVSGVLSLSATAPTFPSGYRYKALLGAVRNDALSNFKTMHQVGDYVAIKRSENQPVLGGTANTFTDLDLSAMVPLQARIARGSIKAQTSIGGGFTMHVRLRAGTATNAEMDDMILQGGTSAVYIGGQFTIAMATAQNMEYRVDATTTTADIELTSYQW